MSKVYDVIIIGAGPAGLSAGLYAARSKMSTLIIEKEKTVDKLLQQTKLQTTQVVFQKQLVLV